MSALDAQVGGNHYKKYGIQPVEMYEAHDCPALEALALRYVIRWADKNGKEDLRKALHLLDVMDELRANPPEVNVGAFLAQFPHREQMALMAIMAEKRDDARHILQVILRDARTLLGRK